MTQALIRGDLEHRQSRERIVVRTRRLTSLLPPVLLGAAILALWAAWAPRLGPILLPSPASVLGALGELSATGDLWPAAATTAWTALRGVLLAVVVAAPLAWVIVHSRYAAAALEPYIAASQAIPAVAMAPLLVLWFGYGSGTTALLAALMVFFPVVVTGAVGLRSLDREVLDAARVDGAGAARMLRHLELPLALPQLLAGIRVGVTLAMIGAIVGEFVIGGEGLGRLLVTARDRADTSALFATLLVVCAVSMTGYGLVRLAEHRAALMTER